MKTTHTPTAKAEMLIRKPVAEVFRAFVDPTITSKFWFTKSSGPLETGKHVKWEWEMYDFSVPVNVKAVEQDKRILIDWGDDGDATTVEWVFTARPDNTTFVSVRNSGFRGDADETCQQAIDSTEGFAFVLAGAKALIEQNVRLNLVPDRHPDGLAAATR
ncbi:MAG: SRPBCC family protein [Gemmatimonadaceae bacterium]